MPKGYWVATVEVHDPEQYKKYVEANGSVFAKYGAKFLVRAGKQEVGEGKMGNRTVVLEFPSYQAAHDCWHSDEYQEVRKLRLPAAEGNMVIIEGYEG